MRAETLHSDHVSIQLIKSPDQESDFGKVGVHYKLDPEWHIYWKNPGDSGAAPKFQINDKEVTEISWPYPKRIPVSHLVNFGYENEVVIFLDLPDFTEKDILKLEWLVCKIDCIPGFGEFQLSSNILVSNPKIWRKFQNRLPRSSALWSARFVEEGLESYTFHLSSRENKTLEVLKNIFVFPQSGKNFSTKAANITAKNEGFEIKLKKTTNISEKNSSESFTLVFENKESLTQAVDFNVKKSKNYIQLLWGLILAFLGGLLLNLMPCVFPVLFLKAHSFIKAENSMKIKKSSWVYSFGVVFSFFLLGLMIILFKTTGQGLGWGFQLQSPVFVSILILVFFIMSLSFLEILKLDAFSLPKFLSPLMSSDFGTGVLAVIVASPCTAPFMGVALGLALILSPIEGLLIFMTLGVGLAFPVPLLAHSPGLIRRLPRSGPWMNKFKKMMSIPLLMTCVWLGWVLNGQLSGIGMKDPTGRWSSFSEKDVVFAKTRQSVFIDFTAAWCITCQVNKQTVLEANEIQELFHKNNVYLVRADWTNYSGEVTEALRKYNRNSVPFYVYYDYQTKTETLLPELLTLKDVRQLFK